METYTILIKMKNKAVKKSYNIAFENQFDAIKWGEKQAEEFGPGYKAELGPKLKK